jgi:hypothetical protein
VKPSCAGAAFEQQLVDDGILLFKYWLCCDQASRKSASPNAAPIRSSAGSSRHRSSARATYDDYTKAREDMLRATHTSMRRGRWWISTTRSAAGSPDPRLLDRLPDTRVPEAEFTLNRCRQAEEGTLTASLDRSAPSKV